MECIRPFFFPWLAISSGHYGFYRMSTSLHRWRRCFVSWRWRVMKNSGGVRWGPDPGALTLGEFLGEFFGVKMDGTFTKKGSLAKGKVKDILTYCCRIRLLRWAEGEFYCKTCSEDIVFNIWIAFAESVPWPMFRWCVNVWGSRISHTLTVVKHHQHHRLNHHFAIGWITLSQPQSSQCDLARKSPPKHNILIQVEES